MAADKVTVLSRILQGVLGGLIGMAGANGNGSGYSAPSVNSGIAGRILGGISPDTVMDYPRREGDFHYYVDYIPGPPQSNAIFNGNNAPMRMQTLQQHNAALNKYIRPGMNPIQLRAAIEKGRNEEKLLQEFWSDDKEPRLGNARSSSSAVSGVHILSNGNIEVQFNGKGKWYTYRGGADPYQAALEAHDLVTSRSLGRNMNSHDPASWGSRHKLY